MPELCNLAKGERTILCMMCGKLADRRRVCAKPMKTGQNFWDSSGFYKTFTGDSKKVQNLTAVVWYLNVTAKSTKNKERPGRAQAEKCHPRRTREYRRPYHCPPAVGTDKQQHAAGMFRNTNEGPAFSFRKARAL